jgi:hypothetical protein
MKTMKYDKEVHNPDSNALFLWCLHCERTYRRGECREVNGLQMCPYDGCDGDTVTDAFPWSQIRDANPQYPVIPEHGARYAMYPKQSKEKGQK